MPTDLPPTRPTPTAATTRRGADLLVDMLEAQGVERVFCVPGESYLAVLDALYGRDIAVTVTRHEGGAAFMAEAWGKRTGRPGIAFVTRGPGATNAGCGLHVAQQDSTPVIVFVGQVARAMRGRDAFQEVDYPQLYGGIAKWVAEIDEAARVPEFVSRAFHVAMAGRPGPVVLALPEDMLREEAAAHVPPERISPPDAAPSAEAMDRLEQMLVDAERPFLLLGGAPWTTEACADIARFAESYRLPVSVTFRRQMLVDHLHPNYAGELGIAPNPKLKARIAEADLLIVVGDRLSEIPSQGYTLFAIPRGNQRLVHVLPGPEELGRVYDPHLAVAASPAAFARAAAALPGPVAPRWQGAAEAAHADYLAWSEQPPEMPGAVSMGAIMVYLRERVPDAVLTNGAGNYSTWTHRFWRFRRFGSQIAPISGSMGYGLPAAIAVKLHEPAATVLAFAGDGCFQMTGNEFATAVQEGAAVVVIVVDNAMYGTIRMHQARDYPGRVSATQLRNPDFAALARACGGHGETVRTTDEFAPAFERALASGKPALIHVFIDPRAIAPGRTLSD